MEASQNKEPSLYRDVLKRAWTIVWTSKFLVFFGFFAAFVSNGEQFDVLYKNVATVLRLQELILPALLSAKVAATLSAFWLYFKNILIEGTFIATERFDAVLIFLAVIIAPIVVSQIALISATSRALQGRGKPTFGSAMSEVGKNFVPILVLNVLIKVVVYGLLFAVSYPLFRNFIASGGSRESVEWLAGTTFVILVPLHIIVSFLVKFASAFVIIEGQSVRQSIVSSWKLFSRHWLIALEMSFLLILINVLASGVVMGTLTHYVSPTGPTSTITFYLFVFALGSLLAAFQYAAWTALFLRLQSRTAVSKLARWADILANSLGARKTAAVK